MITFHENPFIFLLIFAYSVVDDVKKIRACQNVVRCDGGGAIQEVFSRPSRGVFDSKGQSGKRGSTRWTEAGERS
jgi:hypothetical protein